MSAATRALKHIRRENVDAAFSQDGNANECEVCDNRTVGGEVHLCSKCPRVFHFKCIPPGRRKPQKGTHEAWWCRDPQLPIGLDVKPLRSSSWASLTDAVASIVDFVAWRSLTY